ncbi:MAG: hypothetical protein LBP79_03890, partial [Clostridiales bacterium]|nr:hypothetical protein [Clostridiales bacterium]
MIITFKQDGSAVFLRGEALYKGSNGVNNVVVRWEDGASPGVESLVVEVETARADGQASGFVPCTVNSQAEGLEYYRRLTGWELAIEGELRVTARWYHSDNPSVQAAAAVLAYVNNGRISNIALPDGGGYDNYIEQLKAALEQANDAVQKAVAQTAQTYVDTLKAQGVFDADAQKAALEQALSAAQSSISADAKT